MKTTLLPNVLVSNGFWMRLIALMTVVSALRPQPVMSAEPPVVSGPGGTANCGPVALYHLVRLLQPTNQRAEALLRLQVPPGGMSMQGLADLGRDYQLSLAGIEGPASSELPVPSIAHYHRGHFVAILEKRNGRFRVADPALGGDCWMGAERIHAEASGRFLVFPGPLAEQCLALSPTQMRQTFGADQNDPCLLLPVLCGAAPSDAGDDDPCNDEEGDSGEDEDEPPCPDCSDAGMPAWRVHEPYANVWIKDTPVAWRTSLGGICAFKLTYKQHNSRADDPNIVSVGPMWECSWLGFVTSTYTGTSGSAILHVMGGGERSYIPNGSTPEYRRRSIMAPIAVASGGGYSISYARGAVNSFQASVSSAAGGAGGGGLTRNYRSKRVDKRGRTTQFGYSTTSGTFKLSTVTDADNRVTTLGYNDSRFPNQITDVVNAWGAAAHLQYNSAGLLQQITDAGGLVSTFTYYTGTTDLATMVTPYGTTTFRYPDVSNTVIDRAVDVTEADGNHQLFICHSRHNSNIWNADLSSEVPHLPFPDTLQTLGLTLNNSFHWGRLQYAMLPDAYKNPADSPNLTALNASSYLLARGRHWLKNSAGAVGMTLGMEVEPSLDGVHCGQKIWYDYDGKTFTYSEGTMSLPSVVALVLPDNTTRFTQFIRNAQGNPLTINESYTQDFGVFRTRSFTYTPDGADAQTYTDANTPPRTVFTRTYVNHQITSHTDSRGTWSATYYDDGTHHLRACFENAFMPNWPIV